MSRGNAGSIWGGWRVPQRADGRVIAPHFAVLSKLGNRLRNGEQIMIEGGTGTEVERRGVPQLENAWNGGGTLSHPDIVRGIHEDYIGHGAEVVQTPLPRHAICWRMGKRPAGTIRQCSTNACPDCSTNWSWLTVTGASQGLSPDHQSRPAYP